MNEPRSGNDKAFQLIKVHTFYLRLDALDGVEVAVVGGQPQHLMAVIPDQIINLKKTKLN